MALLGGKLSDVVPRKPAVIALVGLRIGQDHSAAKLALHLKTRGRHHRRGRPARSAAVQQLVTLGRQIGSGVLPDRHRSCRGREGALARQTGGHAVDTADTRRGIDGADQAVAAASSLRRSCSSRTHDGQDAVLSAAGFGKRCC
jgi:signal recognition particle GTPase